MYTKIIVLVVTKLIYQELKIGRVLDEDGHRKAPPLNGTGHTWHHDDETLHKIIKYGLVGIISDYEGKMGAFGDKLNDKDIDSVLAYIKSFWPDDYYQHQINLSK